MNHAINIGVIENRQKTWFYERAFSKLNPLKFKTFWFVQNKCFKPKQKNIFCPNYPSRDDLFEHKNDYLLEVEKSDRAIKFFNTKSTHYKYYFELIKNWILSNNLKIIFGEATLFHELIAIEVCKELGVKYYHPTTNPYPLNTFSFMKFDTKIPSKKILNKFSEEDVKKLIYSFKHDNIKPIYMQEVSGISKIYKKFLFFSQWVLVFFSWLCGERFNTASPFKKIALEVRKNNLRTNWNSKYVKQIPLNKNILLYPVHMQPEANIDTWGRSYSDQQKLISSISNILPSDWVLLVKPNPKMKYELSREFMNIISKSTNTYFTRIDEQIEETMKNVDMTITVAGSIGIECFFKGRKFIELSKSNLNNNYSRFFLKSLEDLPKLLTSNIESDYLLATEMEKVDLAQRILAVSHYGVISDPISMAQAFEEENIEKFKDKIEKLIISHDFK